jgi:hypothetical protein
MTFLCYDLAMASEYDTFTSLVDRVISVPHAEIQKRVEAHKKAAAKNPHRRGPKPKKRAARVSNAKS